MSALLEAVTTERDQPRSRNTLDDEEEADARIVEELAAGDRPRLVLLEGKSLPKRAGALVVAVGSPVGSLCQACFSEGATERIGAVASGPESCAVHVVAPDGSDGAAALLVLCPDSLSEASCFDLAQFVVGGGLGGGRPPQRVVVLGTIKTSEYMQNGSRCDPPLVRVVASSTHSLETCERLGLRPLEPGNVVTGLASALLTQCVLESIGEAVLLLTLRESHLGPDTMTGCVSPALAALENAGLGASLRGEADVRADASRIREVRAVDREQLYI